MRRIAALVALVGSMAGHGVAAGPPDARDGTGPAPLAARARAGLPTTAFLENGGRLPERVAFTVEGADRTLFFGDDGATIALHDADAPARGRWTLRFAPEGARAVRPLALEPRPHRTHLLRPAAERAPTDLRSFGRLVQRETWPGIDLAWTCEPGVVSWECRVRPGADPARIAFALEGASAVGLDESGALVAQTPLGRLEQSAPRAWQDLAGRRVPVAAAFRLGPAPVRVSLALGPHDPSRELVIDPSIVVRSVFLGGGSQDAAAGVSVDSSRNVYVAGAARSPEQSFPEFLGPDLTYNGGASDAFVAKLDQGFTTVWAGYLGGGNTDAATCVSSDGGGSAYVGGYTLSADFPVAGALGPAPGGGIDGFLARVAGNGRSLSWSGYVGGPGEDRVLAMTLDRFAKLTVAGRSGGGIPVATGYRGGVADGFAAGVRGDGAFFEWARYVGGAGTDAATAVALDALGNVYLCGTTTSPEGSFQPVVGPDLTHNGGQDAWVAKLDASTRQPVFAGYVGGAALDEAAGIAVNAAGTAIVVVGTTNSTEASFPAVVGPHLVHAGKSDGFVATVASGGASLASCGFVGGTGDDAARAVAVDASGNAVIVGTTGSTERGFPSPRSKFPVVDGPDLTFNGGVHDGWIGILPAGGAQMATLGYLGGPGNLDDVVKVAVHANSDVVVAGVTTSPAKSFPGGASAVSSGATEAFVSLLQFAVAAPLLLVPRVDAVAVSGFDVVVNFTDADPSETAFEVQRTAADGTTATFTVATGAGTSGPLQVVDTTAAPGTEYAYRVRAVDAARRGEYSDCVLVQTTPSLELRPRKSAIRFAGTDLAGTLAAKWKFSIQEGAAVSAIDPVADGLSLTLSGAGPDVAVVIPALDPAWTTTGSVSTWVSPGGDLRVVVDLARRTVRFEALGLSLAPPLAKNTLRAVLRTGAAYGSQTAVWRGAKGTRYRYP